MNPVALITGGSNGIGASTVIEFASHGYNVVINYNTSQKNALELAGYVKQKFGVDAYVVKADISSEFQVQAMIEGVIDKYGQIDVLVNNAGIIIDKPLMDRTVEDFRNTVSVNLIGTFIVSKYASKWMLERKRGKIINVAASKGIDSGTPTSVDYDATKAGIISLTKNFAVHCAPYINVNAVAPGWVNTNMNQDLPIDFVGEEIEKILLKRFADPEEIAKVIYFLASDSGNYINGEVIKIDGGR